MSARILDCVNRAFYAIGAASNTQEIMFWNLYVTRNVGRNEITEKPALFMEGIRDVYGEAGTVVFEYKLTAEIKREFGLSAAFEKQPAKGRSFVELMRMVAVLELGRDSESPSQ